MRRPRFLVPVLAACLAALLALPGRSDGDGAPTQPAPPARPARKGGLTILHTNDWHGYALAETPRPRRNRKRPAQGGVAAMRAVFEKVKAEAGADRVLAFDAGDLLTGHPGAALVEDGVTGTAFIKAWGEIGYDAWVIGNHDFDAGRRNAEAIVKLAKAPCLVANLLRAEDGAPLLPGTAPCKVFERGGLKVGVLGLVTADLARLASAETMAGVRVVKLAEAARPILEKLSKETDIQIALTHAGVEADRELARAVPELDVIVGGHSHTRLTQPIVEGGCLIVQAGCNGREYGRLDLEVEGGRIASHKAYLQAAIAEGVSPTAEMAAPLARIEAYMAGLEGETLGEVTQALTRGNYYGETLIGSFIADAVKDAAKADVGFMNSGGIRADFPRGKVSRAALLKAMPTDDGLAAFEASGAELEAICLHNARAALTHDHGVLQVAGVRYRWKKVNDGVKDDAKVLEVTVGGKPLDRAKTYVCATSSFVATEQAVKYLGYEPKGRRPVGKTVHAALVDALRRGPIELPDRRRMWEERGPKPAPAPATPAPKEPAPATPLGDDEEEGE